MRTFIFILAFGLSNFFSISQTGGSKSMNPSQTVDFVFKDYIKYNESTDSEDAKLKMEQALVALQKSVQADALPLLINVWMYYDPTDFPTRDLIEPIFFKNRTAAKDAVTKRLKKKRKGESLETAPYSDLVDLEKRLQ